MSDTRDYTKLSWEDEFEIRLLSDKLFHAADRGNKEVFKSLWAKNCNFTLNMREPADVLIGKEAVVEFVENAVALYVDLQRYSCHMMSHINLTPAGDHIKGQGVGIMTLIYDPVEEGGDVLVRGVHYDDEYIYEDGAWRIQKRIHQPKWQYKAKTLPHGVPLATH